MFAFDAVKVTWGSLPMVIGDLAYQAADNLVFGVQHMIRTVQVEINKFLASIDQNLQKVGLPVMGMNVGAIQPQHIDNPFAGYADEYSMELGAAGTAFEVDYMGQAFGALSKRAQEIALARQEMDELGGSTKAANDNAKSLGATLSDAARTAQQEWEFYRGTLSGFFSDLKSGLKDGQSFWESFGQAASNALDSIADRLGFGVGVAMLALKPLDFTGAPYDLFILAGQSNMSGRGLLSEVPTFAYASRVKIFSNAWTWVDGYEPVDDEAGQIDVVSRDTQTDKASAGMSFGSTLAGLRSPNRVGLIPCAKGSTGLIADWGRNLSRSTLYGSMIARAKAARAYGTLRGVIWYQGEHEANSERTALANSYATDWLAWAQNVCDDLEDQNLKFIVTELGPNPDPVGFANWATVQSRLQSLDGARSGNVACVSAADLDGKVGDEIHIDTASQVTLGQRYASAMDTLLG